MAFTTPSTDLGAFDWRSAAIVNEIRAGIRERQALAGVSLMPLAVAGTDSAQSASANFRAMQYAIEGLVPLFCDHTAGGGDFSGMAEMPMWQITDSTAPHFFFQAAISADNWHARTIVGEYITGGAAATVGHLIGTWLYSDLQAALAMLRWVPKAGCSWLANGENNNATSAYPYLQVTWPIAQDYVTSTYAIASSPMDSPPTATIQGADESGAYSAIAKRVAAYLSKDSLPTSPCAIDIYFQASPSVIGVFDHYGDQINGSDISESATGVGSRQTTYAYNGSGSLSLLAGSMTLSLPSPWCDEPTADNPSTERGYTAGSAQLVIHGEDFFVWQ